MRLSNIYLSIFLLCIVSKLAVIAFHPYIHSPSLYSSPPNPSNLRSLGVGGLVENVRNKTNEFMLSPGRHTVAATTSSWERFTRGRRGLLVYLGPAVFSQLLLLQRIFSFLFSRLVQYLNPLLIGVSIAMQSPRTLQLLQTAIWSSVAIGTLYMLTDTLRCGVLWAPLAPPEHEAVAVVTGATSGLGFEMAKLLYHYGYSVVLVGREENLLQTTADMIQITDIQSNSTLERRFGGSPDFEKQIFYLTVDLNERDSALQIKKELVAANIFHHVQIFVHT